MHKLSGSDSLTTFETELNEALEADIQGPGEEAEKDEDEDDDEFSDEFEDDEEDSEDDA